MTASAAFDTEAGRLRFRRHCDGEALTLSNWRLVVAGYTGRDAEAVLDHIAELAAIGVPPPETVPSFYDLDPALATTAQVVTVDGASTSGEIEPVIIRHNDRCYLAVGSDHTDRDLERESVYRSKAACPKPLGREVIALGPTAEIDWDAVSLKSWADGVTYQLGTAASLRTPGDLLQRLEAELGPLDTDLILFCGTVPLLRGDFVPGTAWTFTLSTRLEETISLNYHVLRQPRDHDSHQTTTNAPQPRVPEQSE